MMATAFESVPSRLMRTLTVLGSSGSIGTNTLDVVRRSRHLYQVYGLAAGGNVETLAGQILEFRPKVVAVATEDGLIRLSKKLTGSALPQKDWPGLLFWDAAPRETR